MDIYYDEEKEAWREYKPYATIDVATEEDYRTLLKAIEREKAKKPIEAIKIVQKWSDEHPPKTRQSEFLKMFPNARLDFDSVLVIEPCAVDKNFASTYCISDHCYICRAEYWLAEVE